MSLLSSGRARAMVSAARPSNHCSAPPIPLSLLQADERESLEGLLAVLAGPPADVAERLVVLERAIQARLNVRPVPRPVLRPAQCVLQLACCRRW